MLYRPNAKEIAMKKFIAQGGPSMTRQQYVAIFNKSVQKCKNIPPEISVRLIQEVTPEDNRTCR